MRAKATYLAFEHPGIRMLIVRRTFPELRENHTSRLLDAYERLPAAMRPRYSDSDKVFLFPGGARLKLGYCDNEDDVRQYQGQEYDVLFIDEATQLSETQFKWLNACVRGAGPFPKRTYLTCNPGGVGHAWVKRLFIDKDYRPGEDPADYAFIRAKVWDNAPLFAGGRGVHQGDEGAEEGEADGRGARAPGDGQRGLRQAAQRPVRRAEAGMAGRRLGRVLRAVLRGVQP